MATLDFYALENDIRAIFKFIYAETDIVVLELSSEYDKELRSFKSLAELESVFTFGNHQAVLLQLWSLSVTKNPGIRRIQLKVPGHSFRFAANGTGLIQLYLDGFKDGVIFHTHFGHWNEAGARERSMFSADDSDWKALRKLSGRIQRHIRKLAVCKLWSRPILPQAFEALEQGSGLAFSSQTHYADSSAIIRSGS